MIRVSLVVSVTSKDRAVLSSTCFLFVLVRVFCFVVVVDSSYSKFDPVFFCSLFVGLLAVCLLYIFCISFSVLCFVLFLCVCFALSKRVSSAS